MSDPDIVRWMKWNDETPLKVLQKAMEKDPVDISVCPILADALEEAGCPFEEMLGDLRSGNEYRQHRAAQYLIVWYMETVAMMRLHPEGAEPEAHNKPKEGNQ